MTDNLIDIRHHLHAHPELSGEEMQTSNFIIQTLKAIGDCTIHQVPSNHSVLAEIRGSRTGPVVLFRCELDALPIEEINDFSYRSKKKAISHKCGHDGHMVIMLGFIQELIEAAPNHGTVLALFQSAEETGEGAKSINDSGVLDRFDIEYVFALHNIPGYPMGSVICKPGIFTPSVESVSIELIGKTSHAGEPEKGISPAETIVDIAKYLNKLHNPDKNSPNYCVSTPIHIQMGEEAYGITAGHAWVRYTIRTWGQQQLDRLKGRIEQTILHTALKKKGLEVRIEWKQPFNANNNHKDAVVMVEKAALMNQLDYVLKKEPFDWGEDFGVFTEGYKGAMFGMGAGEHCPALHNPDYDFPDEMIGKGIDMLHAIAQMAVS